MHVRRREISVALGVALFAAVVWAGAARAESYPTRTVTIIAPFAPGGPSDLVARLLASGMQKELGQSVVVENRPGAGGNIGIGVAARAPADGYTLLLGSSAMPVNAAIFRSLAYDPVNDFVAVSELAMSANVIVVRPDSPFATLSDLVGRAREKPGSLNYASAGVGSTSHLSGELLKLRGGVDIMHVPYRGAAPAVRAVIEGTTEIAVVAIPAAESFIQSGQLRALAVTGARRWASLSGVPTATEAGVADFVSETWSGLFAPRATPRAIVQRLEDAARKAMATPDAEAAAKRGGVQIVGSTSEQFEARYRQELVKIKDLVQRANIPQN